jgi:hypothetical protein
MKEVKFSFLIGAKRRSTGQRAKTALFARGRRSNVRENRLRRFSPNELGQ